MLFLELSTLADFALLLFRILVAVIFISSGWNHLTKTAERAKSIGMSQTFTAFLGLAEILAGLSLISGAYIQVGALIIMTVMLGAIYKKAFVWRTGFWGRGAQGWHYDLLLFLSAFIFLTIGAGNLSV